MTPFPAFLLLNGRPVLVVGAGPVAASKLKSLLETGTRVTVVAPHMLPEVERAQVSLVRRGFEPADIDGCWFVVAAATPEVNLAVARAAEERRVFVNAVDDLAAASTYLGGVVRRGGVTVAISTGGRAPALAGLLREALDSLLPDDLGEWKAEAERLRPVWRAERVPIGERRPLLLRALQKLYATRRAA